MDAGTAFHQDDRGQAYGYRALIRDAAAQRFISFEIWQGADRSTREREMKKTVRFRKTLLWIATAAVMAAGTANAAPRLHTSTTGFNMGNVVGDFDGTMLGSIGNGSDPSIVCGAAAIFPGSPPCPTNVEGSNLPIAGNEATTLYPIDSTFGFDVIPFATALEKIRDGKYGEGWAGNIIENGQVVGLEVSDAETDTFLVPAGMGTWCSGLGGAAVKCSTEHYVVMEHVLTCHETVPYLYADPLTGEQAKIYDPYDPGRLLVDCAEKGLDNNLTVLNSDPENVGLTAADIDGKLVGTDGFDPATGDLIEAIDWSGLVGDADPDDILSYLDPNEATVLDDIAFGDDYSITAKDDGKPLFRWGNLIKRPNDIRLYARLDVPREWNNWSVARQQNGGKGYRILQARLFIDHKITNNPNDQVRPEDMENEAAIGRLPGYTVSGDRWLSDKDCYQGNGIAIPLGTTLRNGSFAIPDTTVPVNWDGNPYAWSEDLQEGLTNAYFTTVDREPFEWAYDRDVDGDGVTDSFQTPQDTHPGQLLSGPRWRLKPPKFGQDIPGLEIPVENCAPPPYQKAMIKYDVGERVTTVLDLLDWSAEDERSINGESPLVWSMGWITSGWFNEGTEVNPSVDIVSPIVKAVSVNGMPVSGQLDLSIYVKGDRKPTALYGARLEVIWE
jgi:hypothetical protein